MLLNTIFEILSARERKIGIFILFFVFFSALFELVGLLSVMPFMAVMGKPELISDNYYLREMFHFVKTFGILTEVDFLTFLGVVSLIVITVSGSFRLLSQFFINKFIEQRRHTLEMRILSIYTKKDYEFFVLNDSQDLSKSVLADVDQFITLVLRPTINMVAYGFVLGILILTLLLFNFKLALFSIFFLGGISVLLSIFMNRLILKVGNSRTDQNRLRYFHSGEIFSAIKEIKFSNTEPYYVGKFRQASLEFSRAQSWYMFFLQIPNIVLESLLFIGMVSLVLIFFQYENQVDSNIIPEYLPTIGFFGLAVLRLKPAAIAVYNGLTSLKYSKDVLVSISDVLAQERAVESGAVDSIGFKDHLRIENLSFQYRGTNKLVLKNINFTIEKGKSVGIIGSSGAGKSTLLDILMGLLTPTDGIILVDNQPLDALNLRSWQSRIGYVPQHVHLIDDSIVQNIAFGQKEGEIDLLRVQKCCEIVQLSDFIIKSLPLGYLSMVGEKGVQLSGGQKQRIGIARALYHNPEIIIFDEASSALDIDTESEVMSAISEISKSKTMIIVAHRLSTVANCDLIIQMDNGFIKSIGSPSEILNERE